MCDSDTVPFRFAIFFSKQGKIKLLYRRRTMPAILTAQSGICYFWTNRLGREESVLSVRTPSSLCHPIEREKISMESTTDALASQRVSDSYGNSELKNTA